jgi:hypothetical protein
MVNLSVPRDTYTSVAESVTSFFTVSMLFFYNNRGSQIWYVLHTG